MHSMKKHNCMIFLAALSMLVSAAGISGGHESAPGRTLIINVNVFDGISDELSMGQNVLIEGKLIKQISLEPIDAPGAIVIAFGSRPTTPPARR